MEDIEHDAHIMRAFACANVVGPAPPLPHYDTSLACNMENNKSDRHAAVCCRAGHRKTTNAVP